MRTGFQPISLTGQGFIMQSLFGIHPCTTFAALLITLWTTPASSQTGMLLGKVYDEQTGEELVGANVLVVGTQLGTRTDIEGKFVIRNVPPGIYNVRVSFVGYGTKLIAGVEVRAEKQTQCDVTLSVTTVEAEEVVVTAERLLATESALLAERRKAVTVGDGISAEQIKRTPDATSGDALRRVVGVSIMDNKFVFVRGTSERYNLTQLNGVRAASTEPDKKAFAFDMLPANLLENTIVAKTFTPDMPGDFAGGLVQMNTMDFPPTSTLTVSIGSGYNATTTGRTIETYDGSSTDWLGYDSRHRSLPEIFPATLGMLSQEEKNKAATSLPNLWVKRTKNAPVSPNFMASYGGSIDVFDNALGYIAAFSYRNSHQRTDVKRADYDDAGLRYEYDGLVSSYAVLWGGVANVSYKAGTHHKVSLKTLFSQAGEDEVVSLAGFNNLTQNDDLLTGFKYVSRSALSVQLSGDHVLKDVGDLTVNWIAAYGRGTRLEPDLRRMIYARSREIPNAQYEAQIPFNDSSPESASRFYGSLRDESRSASVNLALPLFGAKVKFGSSVVEVRRSFTARQFVYTMPVYNPRLTRSSLDTLFIPSHLGGPDGLQFAEYGDRRNRYDAAQHLYGSFAMVDLPFAVGGTDWRVVVGARLEHSEQVLHSGNRQNEDVHVTYKKIDLLPSLNLTYLMTETMNLRLAYSQTVNRPEFREFAPFAFYDFSTQLTTYGNSDLRRALVRNYDLRWEWFPNPGEVFSISYFQKNISDAIEQVVVATVALAGERTFANAPTASNHGVEIELRKSLGFLGSAFDDVAIMLNYSRIFSKVQLSDRVRTLQGQSPYAVNAGVYITLPQSGTSINLLYNRFGERITEVATVFTLDVKEQPRDVLDVTITQALFQTLEVKFAGRDVLAQEQRFMQGDELVRANRRGATYSLGLTLKF